MTRGVSPDRRHYFPAFPYRSYRLMPVGDVLDLWAYLPTLKPVRSPGRAPDLAVPGPARRALGLWKLLALRQEGYRPDPERTPSWNRGAYLTNGPGHCGECHTPRHAMVAPDASRGFAGGPHPRDDEGEVQSLLDLQARGRYADAADLTLALQHGETLGYDKLSSGGMADVPMNPAMSPENDLRAIADYLLSLE